MKEKQKMDKHYIGKINYTIFAGVFIGIFLCFSFAHALDTPKTGVQVSPIRFDWVMKSGEEKSGEIVVHNFSDFTRDVEVQVEDFYVSNDSQEANFFVPDDNHPLKAYDVINWIDVPDDFTIQPGETKKFPFTVVVPDDQPTSGYYGTIFFKTRTDDATAQNESGEDVTLHVNYRVGVLITLAVQGDEPMHISGETESFGAAKKIFWQTPMTMYARLKSDGNVHYKAGGEMVITKFGKRFAVVHIDDEIMYPGRIRIFTEQVSFRWWDYGMYGATLNMQSEDGSVNFTGDAPTFFVIPWKTTAIIVGVILLIFFAIKAFKKRYAIIKKKKE